MMFGLNIAWYAKISEFSTIYVHVQYISLYSVTSDLGVLMGVCLPEGEAFKTGI